MNNVTPTKIRKNGNVKVVDKKNGYRDKVIKVNSYEAGVLPDRRETEMKEYKRSMESYDTSGFYEKMADNAIEWWETSIDFFMNFFQGQGGLIKAHIRYTQLNNNLFKFECFETGSTGIGMSKEVADKRYFRPLTQDEVENLTEKEKSKGLGVHTMGVKQFTAKMIGKSDEGYKKGVEIVSRTKDDEHWYNHIRNPKTMEDVVPFRDLTHKQAVKEGYPVDKMGDRGLYVKLSQVDTSNFGDDWFDLLVKLVEFYFVFPIKDKKIDFTFEYINLNGESRILKPKELIVPCVDSSPYYDVWEEDDMVIGGNTFKVQALVRPDSQEYANGSDFTTIRKKFGDRRFKHPISIKKYEFRDNFAILYTEEETGVIIGMEVVTATSKIRHRGIMRVIVDRKKVFTDTAKSKVKFYKSNGEVYTGKTDEAVEKMKDKFGELFPHSTVDELKMRKILKDIFQGKQWPKSLSRIAYESLCKVLDIPKYDYEWARKNITGICVHDSKLDIYIKETQTLIELKIENPHMDKDYNQILAYAWLLEKQDKYKVKKIITLASSKNSDDFSDDIIEKFETKLNTYQDDIEFKIVNLKDYGLTVDAVKDGFKLPIKSK